MGQLCDPLCFRTDCVTEGIGGDRLQQRVRFTFLGVERLERSEPVVLCLEVGLEGIW